MRLSLHLDDTTFAKQWTRMLDNKTYRMMLYCANLLYSKWFIYPISQLYKVSLLIAKIHVMKKPQLMLNTIMYNKHLSHLMTKSMNELAHKSPLISSSSVLCFTKRKKREGSCRLHEEQVRRRKRLGGNLSEVFQEIYCFSAGIYEDESGMMQYYAHFYIYLQIGIYSDLAMLCYYKVFYFRTLLAICFTLISLHLRHQ